MLKPFPSQSEPYSDNPSASAGLPHSREAEEAVIGAILINPDVFWDVMDILKDEDFYIHRLRFVWVAYCTLFGSGEPVDILTVSERLDDMGRLDEIGGQAYLVSLLNQVPTTLHVEAYANMVAATSLRRQYLVMANRIATISYDASISIDEVNDEIERLYQNRMTTAKTTITTAGEAADKLQKQIEDGIPQGVTTGLPAIDGLVGGYPRKGVAMVYGGSSIGKTAFCLQAAESVCFSGKRALYITLESSPERMVARRVFSQNGVPMRTMRDASMTPDQKKLVLEELPKYKAAHPNLSFDDRARTLGGIERSIRQHRPDLVVIDDLAHIRPDRNAGRQSSDVTLLLETVMRLKDMGIDHDCAILVIHTMTSDEVDKFWATDRTKNVAPSLTSLGWAKDLTYRVDVLVGLVPDFRATRTDDILKVIAWFLKDREGTAFDTVELWFNKPQQWFYDNTTRPTVLPPNPLPPLPAQAHQQPAVASTNTAVKTVGAMSGLPKPKPTQGRLVPIAKVDPPVIQFDTSDEPPEEDEIDYGDD